MDGDGEDNDNKSDEVANDNYNPLSNISPVIYKCTEGRCSKIYQKQENFIRHLLSHKDMKYSCELCDAKHRTKAILKSHMKRTHRLRKCGFCNYTTRMKREMIIHKKSHPVPYVKQTYICPICEFEGSRRNRSHHMKTHEEKKESTVYIKIPCNFCYKPISNSPSNMSRHLKKCSNQMETIR